MRKLKLDDKALSKLLDELDAHDLRAEPGGPTAGVYFSYRIAGLRVEFDRTRDESEALYVPSRKLGAAGVYFLVANLIHTGCTCRVHLVTVRNNWQTVDGTVARCRYLPGTNGIHEVYVEFHRRVDPASFAPAATCSRILAADDSAVSLKLYERLLDTMNVDLTCVTNGVDAVERALDGNYDLILIDIEMPEMDGLEAVRLLRSKGYVRAIVAVSALTEDADRERCLSAGCDDFLAKPLTRERLATVVNRNRTEPLVSEMLDDANMFELIDNFVAGLGDRINRLEAAFGTRDLEEIERAARFIKGEAAGVGFGSITDAAASVETAIRKGEELEALQSKLTELIRLCMAARPATSRFSDTGGASGEAAPACSSPDVEDVSGGSDGRAK